MVKLIPLYDRVLIKVLVEGEKKHGLIIIPAAKGERNMNLGEVIRVGNGVNEKGEQIKMQLKPGDLVWINKFSGAEILHETGSYVIMREYEVFGKQENDGTESPE
jgi:co-chaperonin GroES (HSP10)